MQLSLLLPTLDERENLVWLVPELLGALPQLLEIIVVDDGSTDGTREWTAAAAATESRLRLLARDGVPSLAASLRDGIAAARGDVIGWMDADGAIEARDFARLVAAVEAGAEIAIGSRFAAGGGIKGQRSDGVRGRLAALSHVRNSRDRPAPVALSWALNAWLLPWLLGDGVHDYTSGIVVAQRALLERVPLEGQHGEYCIGLLARARELGSSVQEIGYRVRSRRLGRSKTAPTLVHLARRGASYLGAALAVRRSARPRRP